MSPNDPRHGTYAGYMAHRRSGTPRCQPCLIAQRRTRKGYQINGGQMVTIGKRAWTIVHEARRTAFSKETGISTSVLYKIDKGGPNARVYARTRNTILNQKTAVTQIGLTRRLQALSCLGWSTREISRLTGIWPDNLVQIRLGQRSHYTKTAVGEKIAAAYDELSMTPAPPGRGASFTRTVAKKYGWVPPMAWDDIDDPDATPTGTNSGHTTDVNATRAYELEHLAFMGDNLEGACRALGIRDDALWAWCKRHGNTDLYETLARRSRRHENQYTNKGAA